MVKRRRREIECLFLSMPVSTTAATIYQLNTNRYKNSCHRAFGHYRGCTRILWTVILFGPNWWTDRLGSTLSALDSVSISPDVHHSLLSHWTVDETSASNAHPPRVALEWTESHISYWDYYSTIHLFINPFFVYLMQYFKKASIS